MREDFIVRGRLVTPSDVVFIRSFIEKYHDKGRTFISKELCRCWNWRQPNGALKDMACRDFLSRLEKRELITLPPPKSINHKRKGKRLISLPLHDKTSISSSLKECLPIRIEPIRWTPHEPLFNTFLSAYHYLGYCQFVGAHLKYMAFSKQRPLACLGFAVAAWRLNCRDRFIGWDDEARKRNLHLIANNVRFLILPWVKVPHLASHLLSLIAKRISSDWKRVYGYPIVLLETFVEKERFFGTCYKAANWIKVGETCGRGRNDRYNQNKGPIKAVFVYPLHKDSHLILKS
jgi:hypothetical protein